MLGTSLSVSTSIGNELQLKQREVFDNFQVKTAESHHPITYGSTGELYSQKLVASFADTFWTRHAIVCVTCLNLRRRPLRSWGIVANIIKLQILSVLSVNKFNNGEGFPKI